MVLQNPLAKLSKKDPPRPIEKQIMKMTDETDLDVVRELLEKYKGNFDEVVSHIFEKAYRDEHGEEEGDKGETPVTDNGYDIDNDNDNDKDNEKEAKSAASKDKFEPDAAATNESIPNEDRSKQGSADIDTTEKDASPPSSPSPRSSTASPAPSSPSKEARTDTPPPSEPAKGIVPKKRMSSREKKEQAKRNQKLNRKNKGKVEGSSESSRTDSPSGGSASSPGSMRELFV